MPELLSDEALLARLVQNDERALSELARRHVTWLVNTAMVHTESFDVAEDVVQDVFVYLWESRATLNRHHTSVRALLYRAVRNRAVDVMRKERTMRARAPDGLDDSVGIALPLDDGECVQRMEEALDRALMTLQPRTREIFVLRAQHGMEISDIAESLGISVGTVYTQLYRATKQLAQHPDIARLRQRPE